MEEKVILTKEELKKIIKIAYNSGLLEELDPDNAMKSLRVAYSLARIEDSELPNEVRFYCDDF